jgi:hypothetical protein
MPALPGLDTFPYVAQEEDALSCVVDCVDMVLQYWGIEREWRELGAELDYSVDDGTPFENVRYVSGVRSLRVGAVAEIEQFLERGIPVVANLEIGDAAVLGYHSHRRFLHAVVVVKIDADAAELYDPQSLVQLSSTAPRRCGVVDFERCWRSGWAIRPL